MKVVSDKSEQIRRENDIYFGFCEFYNHETRSGLSDDFLIFRS